MANVHLWFSGPSRTRHGWTPSPTTPSGRLWELGMAAAYVSGITLLFQRDAWQRRLAVLAPVGRMALTNYFTQSVMGVLIFYGYGLGLMGKLGPASSAASRGTARWRMPHEAGTVSTAESG